MRIEPDTNQKAEEARELCEKGLWPQVLAFAQEWHAENPEDAKALFYQGVALTASGRFVEAETAYRRALQLDATDFKAWNNLAGVLFESRKKPGEAIQCMQRALKVDPQNKVGWANLTSMVGRLGRHDKALEFAERALTLDPNFVEAHLHKATAAKALGRTEIVKEVCAALATIEPDNFRRTR
ncbi:MAG: tetratricopeptide repeat protein [Verrucomicrobiota bacterium]|jgi:tetratricopeptide (TPR) repeat protein